RGKLAQLRWLARPHRMGRASVPERPARLDTVIILLERDVNPSTRRSCARPRNWSRAAGSTAPAPRRQPAFFELARHRTADAVPLRSEHGPGRVLPHEDAMTSARTEMVGVTSALPPCGHPSGGRRAA